LSASAGTVFAQNVNMLVNVFPLMLAAALLPTVLKNGVSSDVLV
jgi:hypothetical protein